MQHFLLLVLFVLSPLFLLSQDADTEKRMQELGFVKVDLNELSKTQSVPKKHCSSCPLKQVSSSNKNTKINYTQEIVKLKNKVSSLEQDIKTIQAANNPDPSVLLKYQTALKNTKDSIKAFEKKLNQSKSPTR
jgi:tryptophanyl-tRNA synthetase